MTLYGSLMAFLMILMISSVLIVPLSVLVMWLIPLSTKYVAAAILPTLIYTTNTLLNWTKREL